MEGPGHRLLPPHAREVAARVIAEELARRDHVVIYLSGAHAYGFPSPDSDLDLKSIHVAPTASLVGLEPIAPTFDRAEIIDGVEIDYTSNELGPALAGVLRGNGNYLERVLGASWLASSPLHDALREVAQRALNRRVHRHYRGFAESQRRELERAPTVKRLLYVLRTTLTGVHLLTTAALVTDLTQLLEHYGLSDAHALIARKLAGERTPLDAAAHDLWRARVDMLFARLDAARDASVLPEEPPNAREVNAFLVEVRRARF